MSMTSPLRSLLADAVRRRTRQVAELHAAADQETELVHEIRVATKEFRAYLPLLEETAGKRFCEREDARLRNAARSLAADRDPLVIRQTLERMARKCDRVSGRDSIHRMLLHLREDRLKRAAGPAPIDAACAALDQSATALRRKLGARLTDERLVEALRVQYRRARKLTRAARRKPGMESWHRWRKAVKALHYQAAGVLNLRPKKLKRLADECWKLQQRLGRHHDLHMTRERTGRLRIDPINEPCRTRTMHLLDREIGKLEKKVCKGTSGFLSASPKKFAAKLQS